MRRFVAAADVLDTGGSVAHTVARWFALAVGSVLAAAVVLVLLAFLASRSRPGGSSMFDPRRRWRLLAGLASLVIAAAAGLVGSVEVSGEPQVNRQIPYMASAGMILVLFAVVGGSLLVADQLRADDDRIAELEDAVRSLATTLEPIVESPPRRRNA